MAHPASVKAVTGPARRLRSSILAAVRRRQPTVIWAPSEGLGFGNFLYLWLRAHRESAVGRRTVVLIPPSMQCWLEAFPLLEALSVKRSDVRLCSRRTWGWFSAYGEDFNREHLQHFITDCLLSPELVAHAELRAQVLTINVRRGNYYSEPHFRGTYSFDILAYLSEALDEIETEAVMDRIHVVSDGVDWCRLKLHAQLTTVGLDIKYCDPTESPLSNFLDCASSAALIGTNSSFSYWAGYVSNVLHGPLSMVVMPRFHARLGADYDAYQLDPDWIVVDNIPGGWDS